MHVFVSLPFEEAFDPIFETVSKVATLRGLDVVRADWRHSDVSPSVMTSSAIRDSRFIIADLTGSNPGVLEDVRYASGLGKPRILISQEAPEKAVFNIQGVAIRQYDPEDLDRLQSLLIQFAVDPSSSEEISFGETTFDGSISARIGLMHMVPGQWENPFAD